VARRAMSTSWSSALVVVMAQKPSLKFHTLIVADWN
jgi:hypothetical protein